MQIVYLAAASSNGVAYPAGGARPAVDRQNGQPDAAQRRRESLALGDDLSVEERQKVNELKQVDREVRAHEQAHLSRAGAYATGAPAFTYTTGPDGKQYAVGGEVKIDTSPEADPEATLRKAETIGAAAAAPSEPSGQDRLVAAKAIRMAVEAQRQIAEQKAAEKDGDRRLTAYGPPPPDDTGRLLSLFA